MNSSVNVSSCGMNSHFGYCQEAEMKLLSTTGLDMLAMYLMVCSNANVCKQRPLPQRQSSLSFEYSSYDDELKSLGDVMTMDSLVMALSEDGYELSDAISPELLETLKKDDFIFGDETDKVKDFSDNLSDLSLLKKKISRCLSSSYGSGNLNEIFSYEDFKYLCSVPYGEELFTEIALKGKLFSLNVGILDKLLDKWPHIFGLAAQNIPLATAFPKLPKRFLTPEVAKVLTERDHFYSVPSKALEEVMTSDIALICAEKCIFHKLSRAVQERYFTPKIAMIYANNGNFHTLNWAIKERFITPEIVKVYVEKGIFHELCSDIQKRFITPEIVKIYVEKGVFHKLYADIQEQFITREIVKIYVEKGVFHKLDADIQRRFITPEIAKICAAKGVFHELYRRIQQCYLTPEILTISAENGGFFKLTLYGERNMLTPMSVKIYAENGFFHTFSSDTQVKYITQEIVKICIQRGDIDKLSSLALMKAKEQNWL